MKFKKLTAMLLALAIGSSLILSACSEPAEGTDDPAPSETTSEAGEDATSEEDSNFNETGYPIVNEMITLTGFGNQNVTHKDWSELYAFTEYEKMSNIHIDWTLAPNEGYTERKNVLLAGGEYPDIFYRANLTVADQLNNGSNGLFVTLNDLIDDYAPNLQARYEDYPELEKEITMPDGNIYTLPTKSNTPEGRSQKNWINARWLDNLGLEMPNTAEELKDVFTAFKEQDANGNGDPNDEFPYSDRVQGNALFYGLYATFGMGNLGTNGFTTFTDVGDDGNIRSFAVSEDFKALLYYLEDLYANGLIDPETFTQDIPAFTAKGEQDRIGAFFNNGSPEIIGAVNDEFFDAMLPLENDEGERVFNHTGPLAASGAFAISSSNPYPRESMRWIDYYYGEEGSLLMWLGEEGVSYVDNGDGTYDLTELISANPEGLNVPQSMGQFALGFAGGGCPVYVFEEYEEARLLPIVFESHEVIAPYIQLDTAITYLYTIEEQNRLNALTADIITYINEMKVAFVTGRSSIDDGWDEYVETLEGMGLQEYVDIHQASYDRWTA